MGLFDNRVDCSVKSKHDGAWQSDHERINAYKDVKYWTDDQARNHLRTYTMGDFQGHGGSARTRDPSIRRPNRPRHER